MGKAGRRNSRRQAAYFIKAFASYHGSLCVYVQDAHISQRLELSLDNLKIDQRIDESISVGSNVLVAVMKSGEKKFRRAAIVTISTDSVDAVDLDTKEYYAEVERGNVHSIAYLGNNELIRAPGAQQYYVHGFHTSESFVNPKYLDEALKAVKGVRLFLEKTAENHFIDKNVSVIKLFRENKERENFANIRVVPRPMTAMPPLFCESIEEVRVYHSAETVGVQLRYLPLHELRRLEVFLMEGLQHEAWKTCDATSTRENHLVAALYDRRMVRGFVTEVRPTDANVYLMDYGIFKKFGLSELRYLSDELAFKLPRYGICVKLRENPEEYFDKRIIKVKLSAQIDECVWEGSIVENADEILEETSERKETKTGAEASVLRRDEDSDEESLSDLRVDNADVSEAVRPSMDAPETQAWDANFARGCAIISDEAIDRGGIHDTGFSPFAPSVHGVLKVPLREAADVNPFSFGKTLPDEQTVPVTLSETGRPESPQIFPQIDLPTANEGGIESPAIRDDAETVRLDIAHSDILQLPSMKFPSDKELEAAGDLPNLGESPLDTGYIQTPCRNAGAFGAKHPGTVDLPRSENSVIVRICPEESNESAVACLNVGTTLWRRILRFLTQIFLRK